VSNARIFTLPDTMNRQWRVFADDLRAQARAGGATHAETEHAVSVVQPLFLRYGTPKAPDVAGLSGDDAVASVNAWARDLVGGIMTELIAREIELHRLGAR
jgi:hypothetical protein